MKTTPWDEILKERYTPKQLAALRARAKRGILVEFYPHDETPTWIARVHGEELMVEARGPSIGRGRRNVRAALERVVGKRRAIALWRERAETMPAGAEEEERERGVWTKVRELSRGDVHRG